MAKVLKIERVLMPMQFSSLVRTEKPPQGEIMWDVEIVTIEDPASEARRRMMEKQGQAFPGGAQ
jgi:hypothetical protein